MSFSEDNLDTACTYSENAYNDNIVGATKIECERTSTTAFVHLLWGIAGNSGTDVCFLSLFGGLDPL